LRTFFSVFCFALLLVGLPGHLLHHVGALLPGHGDTLPASSIGTFLLVHVLGHGGGPVLTDLLGSVTANLAWSIHIIANLSRDWAALLVIDNRTLLLVNLLGADAWNQGTDTEGSWLTVLDGNLLAMLTVQHLAVDLGDLTALEFRNVSALLSGEGATLSGSSLGALSSRNVLALFLLDGLTFPLLDVGTFFLRNLTTLFLGDVTALLLGDLATLLGRNLSALLRVSNLLTDLLVDGVALLAVDSVTFFAINSVTLLSVDSVALALRYILAFLLGNCGAFPLIDHRTLLLRNILADLVLDSVALPVVDDLTLGHSVGGAFLLGHGLALPLVPGGAVLDRLSGAGFFVSSLLNSSGDVDTLQILGIVALLLLHGGTLLADIIGCGTVPLDLKRAFSSLNLLLDRSLRDKTGSLLDIGTGLVRNIPALLPGHRLVGRLGNLVTDFVRHLTTHWLGSCFWLLN